MPDFKKRIVEKNQKGFKDSANSQDGGRSSRQIEPVATNRRSVDVTPKPSFEHPQGHVSAGFRASSKKGILSRTGPEKVFPSGDGNPREPNSPIEPSRLRGSSIKGSTPNGSTQKASPFRSTTKPRKP